MKVALLDTATGKAREAELHASITEKQLTDVEGEWKPALYDRFRNFKRSGKPVTEWPGTENAHWNWRQKVKQLQSLLSHDGYCVTCQDTTEGLMLIDTTSYRCRLPENEKRNLVYIDYVENAPWNRPELEQRPRYRGVGSILVRAAIEHSLAEEFKGRIGLHALPQAEAFYGASCGMTDLGPDPTKQGLRYYEMTSAQAEAFIAKGNDR